MSDANDNDNGGRPGRAPLTLKPRAPSGAVSTGTVKQSFSHGRTKTVVVETKRRRADAPEGGHRPPAAPLPPRQPRPEAPAAAAPRPAAPAAPADTHGLSQAEIERRQRVIEAARAEQERQEAARRAEEAARRAEEEARRREAEAARAAEDAARRAAQSESEPAPSAPAASTPAPAAPSASPRPAAQPTVMARAADTPRPSAPAVYGDRPAAPASAPERPRAPAGGGFGDRARPAGGVGDRPRPAPSGPGMGAREPRYGDRPGGFGDRPRPSGPAVYGDRPRPEGGASYGARPAAPSYGDRPRPEGAYGARPAGGGFGDRPRPAPGGGAGGFGQRPRPEGGGGGGGFGERQRSGPEGRAFGDRDRGPRGPREGGAPGGGGGGDGTVRYSALNARPAGPRTGPGARGPGGPRGPGAAPSTPEFTKTSRSGPRTGEGPRRTFDDDGPRKAGALSRTRGEPSRRQGRLTIQTVAGDEDSAERMRSLASVRRAREREKERRRGGVAEQSRTAREVVIPDVITVGELAQRMAIRAVDVIKFMMRQGIMLKINDVIDTDTAELVATEYGMTVRRVSESDVETGFITGDEVDEDTLPRPPVVAVMGHVDHGKTSLLDALRQTSVVSGEAGGITQHIGAYQVKVPSGESVTFLDTPGHAAFSAMRARGANVTDIIVLVVAADDGVMPQTVEAINHAKAAGAPLIVAVNKIDKPDADPTRVVNELLQHEIVAESLGGETQIIEVSALQKLGLDDLVNAILLQAEVMELRANPDRTGEGVVIESKLDKGRGPVATVLVNRGTLKRGDIVVAGSQWGRVRALMDERGQQKPTAGPSEPVEVLGLDGAPEPSEAMAVVENEARAREIVEYRLRVKREKSVGLTGGVSMADMMARLQNKKISELPLVIKADVGGSAEAISQSLKNIGNEEVSARIILSGVGGITESDVMLAKGANAPIIGFNVRASAQARALAQREGVEIRYYAIIYDLLDDIKGVLSGMLAPIQRETFLGNAEILQVFDISKVGKIGGCRVTEGVVRKGARVRILRNDVVIHDLGTVVTLKRFKDEVNEVVVGQECGMNFGNFQDVKEGDFIECFSLEEIKRTL